MRSPTTAAPTRGFPISSSVSGPSWRRSRWGRTPTAIPRRPPWRRSGAGVRTFRTDRHGTVALTVEGDTLAVDIDK